MASGVLIYVDHDEIADTLKDAVIIGMDFRDSGARLFLADGRTILFPGAETVYVCASKWLLQ